MHAGPEFSLYKGLLVNRWFTACSPEMCGSRIANAKRLRKLKSGHTIESRKRKTDTMPGGPGTSPSAIAETL